MSFPHDARAYTQGTGTARVNDNVVVQQRAPATSDWNFRIGTIWLDQTNIAEYTLLDVSSSGGINSATWLASGGGDSGVATINNLVPSGGNITIAGTSNQISVANAGSTVTISVPSVFTAPGSVTATTTLVATTSIIAGTGITSTTGNIVAAAGNISAIFGSISAGTTVTAGTSITANNGNITATNGNFICSGAGKAFNLNSNATSGTTTATLNGRVGQITITTPSIAAEATFAMTITNSSISGSSTQVGYWLTGGTTGSSLSIQSYVNTASQSVVTIQNGAGATTNTDSLILNFLVIN